MQAVGLAGHGAVEHHVAGHREVTGPRAGQAQQPGQAGVHPLPREAVRDGETALFAHIGRVPPRRAGLTPAYLPQTFRYTSL